jgi:hypothetical protein
MAKISQLPILDNPTGEERVPVLDAAGVTRGVSLRPLVDASLAPNVARVDAVAAQIKQPLSTGKRSGWPDPFFRRFDLTSQLFQERDRWWSAPGAAVFAFTGWSRVPNPVYDGFALRKTYNPQQVNAGPVLWLDEIGAQAGDIITVYSLWANGAGAPTVAQSAIFDNGNDGGSVGAAIPSTNAAGQSNIVAGATAQWLRISAVVPAGAARLALYPSVLGTDASKSADMVALWAFKGAPATGPEAPTLGESYTDDRLTMVERRSAKVNSKRQVRSGYQPFVTYQHPLGDAEMVGDAAFTSPVARLAGAYELLAEDTLFNAVQYRISASNNATPVEWRIYLRDSAAAFNPSTVTPDATGVIAAGSFPTADALYTLALDKPLFGDAGKYVFALFRATDDSPIKIKRWMYNAAITPARHAFPYHATAGAGWNAALSMSAPASGFGQTAIKLLLQSEELRQSGVGAAGVSYNGATSGLTATTAQGAIDELAGGVTLVMPPKIYAAQGLQCNVYYDNLITSPDWRDYSIDVTCTAAQQGQQLNEAWRLTPTGPITSGTLTVAVHDKRSGRLLASASSAVLAAAANAGKDQNKKVLLIGDSLTPGLATALSNLQATDALKLTLLGTQGGAVKHEGRGGWTVPNYTTAGPAYYQFTVSGVTNEPALNAAEYTNGGSRYRVQTVSLAGGAGTITCSLESGGAPQASGTLTKSNAAAGDATIAFSASAAAPGNPFWFNGAVDFAQYLSVNGVATPDYVVIALGNNDSLFTIAWNDKKAVMEAAIDVELAKLDVLIASIKAADPNTRVILAPPALPAFEQDAFGLSYGTGEPRWKYKDRIVLWAKRLFARHAGQEANRVFVASTGTALDTINSFPRAAAEPVNSRSPVTVQRVNNALHDLSNGSQQEADSLMAMFKCLV